MSRDSIADIFVSKMTKAVLGETSQPLAITISQVDTEVRGMRSDYKATDERIKNLEKDVKTLLELLQGPEKGGRTRKGAVAVGRVVDGERGNWATDGWWQVSDCRCVVWVSLLTSLPPSENLQSSL